MRRKAGGQGDRYTVMMRGQRRFLYFERTANLTGKYHRPLVCGTEDTFEVPRMRIDTNCVCWQDSVDRIISFHEVEGLEPKTFPSHESMLDYVLSTVERGYRVQ